jgi:hypothetical protein
MFLSVLSLIFMNMLTASCEAQSSSKSAVSSSPVSSEISNTPPSVVQSTNSTTVNSNQKTITPETPEIITKTIANMDQITSFKLDSDITNTYETVGGNNSTKSIYEWKGTKLTNLVDKEMQIKMTVNTYNSAASRPDSTSFEMYLDNGTKYFNITIPKSYSGWSKTQSEDWWYSELQSPELIQILKNAKDTNLSGNEIIDGVDCFILDVIPTTSDASDWIFSQFQPIGPSKVSTGPTVPYDDKTEQGVMFKLWVSKTEFLILRAEVNILFAGKINITPEISSNSTVSTENISVQFTGQMNFSDYNSPISIEIPAEATNSTESGSQ